MKLYTFVNMYLSPTQHGIQTAHVVSELFSKYGRYNAQLTCDKLYCWADYHKTIIVLNGGTSSNLISIYDQISNQDVHPCAIFREDEDSLNNAVTAVGLILPEHVYGREKDEEYADDMEQRMFQLISSYKLA